MGVEATPGVHFFSRVVPRGYGVWCEDVRSVRSVCGVIDVRVFQVVGVYVGIFLSIIFVIVAVIATVQAHVTGMYDVVGAQLIAVNSVALSITDEVRFSRKDPRKLRLGQLALLLAWNLQGLLRWSVSVVSCLLIHSDQKLKVPSFNLQRGGGGD